MPFYPTGGATYTLNSSISSTQTTITLSSFLEPISETPYTMAIIGSDIVYATIAPKTSQSEFVSFTGITQNADGTATLTGVTRGLGRSYPYTSSSTYKLPHSGQSIFILSDAPEVFAKYAALANDEIITGSWTVPTPVAGGNPTTKTYVDNLVNGGDITVTSVIVTGTAGEDVGVGNVVYLKSSDGKWYKTDADTEATVNQVQLGIAQSTATTNNAITSGVMIKGIDSNQSGGTAGQIGYVGNTAGSIITSPGTVAKAIGNFKTTTDFYFDPAFYDVPLDREKAAMAGGSTFGTPSSTNKYITQDYNKSATGLPVLVQKTTAGTSRGDNTTRFDITLVSGTTYRYTWDGTGTDPSISAATMPVGSVVDCQGSNFAAGNKGLFVVTASATNSFDVTNASGVAENDKTLGTGTLVTGSAANCSYSVPSTVKYIILELVGPGAPGESGSTMVGGAGGSSGGYLKKTIARASLAATEYFMVGPALTKTLIDNQTSNTRTVFTLAGTYIAAGASKSTITVAGLGGTATGGDINLTGRPGGQGQNDADLGSSAMAGVGGSSQYGTGGLAATNTNGGAASGYGSGGGGASGNATTGGACTGGCIVINEFYS